MGFVRNWFQEEMWRKGFTFAFLNANASQGSGTLCLNCGGITPPGVAGWTCMHCGFVHKNPAENEAEILRLKYQDVTEEGNRERS